MDTVLAVRQCIVLALSARNLTQTFEAVSAASIWPAAITQDRIGWMNFTEGKISKQWRQLQAAHYQSTHSRCIANQWAVGLVTTLLSMVHSQWTHCCNILHARDAQGLCLREASALATNQFPISKWPRWVRPSRPPFDL
jgi:hypothetical protein